MIKTVMPEVVVFDSEFVPCVETGRAAFGLEADGQNEYTDEYVRHRMNRHMEPEWKPEDDPPMLKSFMYRVVSVSALVRSEQGGQQVDLKLVTLSGEEPNILDGFFRAVGRKKAQLVGFASRFFDLPVMAQRALVHGLKVPEFFDRPEKPWEGPDYLNRNSDYSVDLMDDLAGGGDHKARPKLDHLARACGIPGKLGMEGKDVEAAVAAGRLQEVVEYNDFDACTTYLLWARMCHLSGLLDSQQENARLAALLLREKKTRKHLADYLEAMR